MFDALLQNNYALKAILLLTQINIYHNVQENPSFQKCALIETFLYIHEKTTYYHTAKIFFR